MLHKFTIMIIIFIEVDYLITLYFLHSLLLIIIIVL